MRHSVRSESGTIPALPNPVNVAPDPNDVYFPSAIAIDEIVKDRDRPVNVDPSIWFGPYTGA